MSDSWTLLKTVDGRTYEGARELIEDSNFSHAREGRGCWSDVIFLYHHSNGNSPSGVTLCGETTKAIWNMVKGNRFLFKSLA